MKEPPTGGLKSWGVGFPLGCHWAEPEEKVDRKIRRTLGVVRAGMLKRDLWWNDLVTGQAEKNQE